MSRKFNRLTSRQIHIRSKFLDLVMSFLFYLEHGENALAEGVKVCPRLLLCVLVVELPAKELHSEEGEDDDEQKEKQQQTGNGSHTVDQ
jgi:hypothetical protein